MNYKDFEKLLANVGINKKDFANLTELSYQTVMNWQRNDNVPKWVKSWLENYIKSKVSDDIIEAVKPFAKDKNGKN